MWARILNIILGLGIMAAPAVFDYNGALANNDYIIGPLVVTFAIIALWDINQQVRLANIVTGGWLMLSAFIFSAPSALYFVIHVMAGLLILLFSLVKGKVTYQYGGGWRSLFQANPEHMQTAEKLSSSLKDELR